MKCSTTTRWKNTQLWTGLVCIIAAATARPVAAQTTNDWAQTPAPSVTEADAGRCTALMDQFTRAAESGPVDPSARSPASRGIALCRRRMFAEGADTLAQALRHIGQAPEEATATPLEL